MTKFEVICRLPGRDIAKKKWLIAAESEEEARLKVDPNELYGWMVEVHPAGKWEKIERRFKLRWHGAREQYHRRKALEMATLLNTIAEVIEEQQPETLPAAGEPSLAQKIKSLFGFARA